uniref:Uncharacterized protein n=1 Tax=Tetranychus urticae TaxID=32264 RepID=T1KKD5_TETUR
MLSVDSVSVGCFLSEMYLPFEKIKCEDESRITIDNRNMHSNILTEKPAFSHYCYWVCCRLGWWLNLSLGKHYTLV